MSVTQLVITDGRAKCLERTIESFTRHVDQDLITHRVIVNDCLDPAYARWIDERFDFDEQVAAPRRGMKMGFGGAIRAGWAHLPASDWVLHLEDDFELQRPWDLAAATSVLDTHHRLAQMALRRQPWNAEETAAGGIIELNPDDYSDATDGEHHWVEHRRFFTTNPSIYRHDLTHRGWPVGLHSEGRFGIDLFADPEVHCAFWGRRDDPPWVLHIGDERIGTGY